jgi:DNA-binding MarR family transcriptional regulator
VNDDHDELAEALLAASRALVGIAIRGLGAVSPDVTLAQHRVLLLLDEHGELSVNEVADLLGVNQSNASRHTTRLVSLGLVARNPVPHDARAVALRITSAGRRRVDAVRLARLNEIRGVLDGMEIADARPVADALRAFEEAARRARWLPTADDRAGNALPDMTPVEPGTD